MVKRKIPFIGDEHPGDEVFGFVGRVYELGFVKAPLAGQDVIQSLVVIVTKEGTETAQTVRKNGREMVIMVSVWMCLCMSWSCLLTACR